MSQPWYEVGKWSIDVNMNPVLSEALTEFTSRIDERLFRRLSGEAICIVDSAPSASTVRVMAAPSPSPDSPNEDHSIYLVVFRPDVVRLTPRAALGEVAHQFAHLVFRLEHGVDSQSLPAGREMADNLATAWGFKDEIEANAAERMRLDAQGSPAGASESPPSEKSPRKKRSGRGRTSLAS
ncbi:MAG: hypothetical protein FJ020_00085 [Chloroflexi bacterium]|nr:hypothetical protein [Chloroflexota bacterium]